MKTCRICKTEKPLSDFHRHRGHKDGHHSACKSCALAEQSRSRLKEPSRAQSQHPAMKRCAQCEEVKLRTEFVRNKNFWDGYNHICKACGYARRKTYGDTAREKINERQRMRYWDNPDRARDRHLARHYRLKPGAYASMLAAQDGKCAICGRDDNPSKTRFAIDHDHTTGKVRGLLCTCCNQAIGQLQDSPELLRKAAIYLETR